MSKQFFVIGFLICSWCSLATAALPVAQGPAAGQVPAVPEATPDTALATLVFPEDAVLPSAISVVPDTVVFGGVANLVLDFPAGIDPVVLPALAFDQDWAVPAGESVQPDKREIASLPRSAGQRLVIPLRIYRIWPFRIAGGTGISRVIHVRGKVANLQDVAPVRTPRLWGMDPKQLIITGLLFAVLVALLSWLWQRRRALPPVMEGENQGPVAWPAFAVRMAGLQQGGLLEQGQTRNYLSELAGIARHYVGERYLVGAGEMTGKEIETACQGQGYEASAVRPFALFIRRVDQSRYNPEIPQPALCRNEFSSLVEMVASVRISPEHTPITAADLIGGQQAWSQLNQHVGTPKGGLS